MGLLTTLDGLAIALIIIVTVCMAEDSAKEKAPMSHEDYLNTLHRPSITEVRRISEIQRRKEEECNSKYHSAEEHEAATRIQSAYRGHRERRQLNGLTLDPSERWVEAIKEWRYRSATSPHYELRSSVTGRQSPTDHVRMKWRKVGQIAEHAGAGERASSPIGTTASSNGLADDTMLMDLRYFLEMVDERHRYGANLQVYHEAWQRSHTIQPFFQWLDRGEGRHLDLPGCAREKLDRECIRYLSKEERKDYLVQIDDQGRLRWAKNNELITTSVEQYKDSIHGIVPASSPEAAYTCQIPNSSASSSIESLDLEQENAHHLVTQDTTPHRHFHVSPATVLNHLLRATVKPGTWIYVADTLGRLYVGIKSSGSFQHASFLSGARISSAGSIGIEDGKLVYLSPLSGHYRPTTRSFKAFIDNLKDQGVDLSGLRVSSAYKVLLGMEYYGKTREGFGKMWHHQGKQTSRRGGSVSSDEHIGPGASRKSSDGGSHGEQERRRGLARLLDDLHIRRKESC